MRLGRQRHAHLPFLALIGSRRSSRNLDPERRDLDATLTGAGTDFRTMEAPAPLGAAGLHRSDPRAPLALRARVFLRRDRLERLLAAGADPAWDPELGLRAAQLTAPRRRRAIAHSLERAVWEAHQQERWGCAVPLARGAVRAATPELSALALDLTAEAAPAAQGVAIARELLRDPSSPLYAPGRAEALRVGAVVARRALG
jgi:hypothetical protein